MLAAAASDAITAEFDVVVVGSGLAGLVTAYELLRKAPAISCCIVEADQRWGGQVQSAGESMMGEAGARWISTDQQHIHQLCIDLGIELVPLRCDEDDSSVASARDWDIDRGAWSKWVRYELDRFWRYVDELSKEFFPCKWTLLNADECSMESFISGNLLFEASRNLVRLVVRFVSGCNADGITFAEYMTLCYGTNGITNQLNCLTGASDQLRLNPYFYRLVALLVTAIRPENILLRTRLVHIENANASVTLHCNDNRKYSAAVVILAISPNAIQELCITPSLPDEFYHRALNGIPSENLLVTGFIVRFDTEFWRNENNRCGSIVYHNPKIVAHKTSADTLSGLFFHDQMTTTQTSDSEVSQEQSSATKMATISIRECILRKLCAHAPSTVHAVYWHQVTWTQTPCRGLPTTIAFGRIVMSGTNAGHSYRGLSNGAVQGGLRAAILTLLIVRPALVDSADVKRLQKACAMHQTKGMSFWQRRRLSFNVKEAVYWAIGVPLGCAVIVAAWPRRESIGARMLTSGFVLWECVIKLLECIP